MVCTVAKPRGNRVDQNRALRVEMGFYVDISWVSRCNIEINV